MAVHETDTDRLVLRVVYDGPGRAGKTANIEQLRKIFGVGADDPEQRGLPPANGRTIYFDWLGVDGGAVDGHRLRIQLVAVPGHKSLEARRAHILRTADAVVLVCDSLPAGQDSARETLDSLREHLGARIGEVPLVVQANKQDLAHALTPHEVGRELRLPLAVPVLAAQASAGVGVRETAVQAVRAALRRIKRTITREGLAALTGRADTAQALLAALDAIPAQAVPEDSPPPTRKRGRRGAGRPTTVREGRVIHIGRPQSGSLIVHNHGEPAPIASTLPADPDLDDAVIPDLLPPDIARADAPPPPRGPAAPPVPQDSLPREPVPHDRAPPPVPQDSLSLPDEPVPYDRAPPPVPQDSLSLPDEPVPYDRAPPPVPQDSLSRRHDRGLPPVPQDSLSLPERSGDPVLQYMSDQPAEAWVRPAAEPLLPTPPGPDIAPGLVWPIPRGREILRALVGVGLQRLPVPARPPEDPAQVFAAGPWRLSTRPSLRFTDCEQARAAIVLRARQTRACAALLPASVALAVQTEADGASRLWHIAPRLEGLREHLRAAPPHARPELLAGLARAVFAALRLWLRARVALDLGLAAFAVDAGRVVHLGDPIGARLDDPGAAILALCGRLSGDPADLTDLTAALEQELRDADPDELAALDLPDGLARAETRHQPAHEARVRLLLALRGSRQGL